MTDRHTILITNIWLASLAGTEVVVRDLALGLLRRGHRPIVYSPTLGGVAEEIAARGVSVIDDLRRLGEAPDIIHAHHSIPCAEALIRFPDVPAIYVCHAFNHWAEAPVHFPQIGAYVAVDEACRDRLVHTEGIDPQRVLMLHNAVDLARIPPRPAGLSKRPLRAAAFGKAAALAEPRTACEQIGIRFDAIGAAAGRISGDPERELVNYDLVFASARSALEALCCGCAVIVCDSRGIAGLVTSQNFQALRAMNFGLRSLGDAATVKRCLQEIARYDPADAARVAERARADADLGKLLDAFELLYDEVLTGARRPTMTAAAQAHAVARFLHDNLPRTPGDARWPWLAERDNLQREVEARGQQAAALARRLDELQSRLDVTERERDETVAALTDKLATLQDRQATATRERDQTIAALTDKLAALHDRLATATRERDETVAALTDNLAALHDRLAIATGERDETIAALGDKLTALQDRLTTMTRERDETVATLRDNMAALQDRLATITRERDETLAALRDRLAAQQDRLSTAARERDETVAALGDRLAALQDQLTATTRERDETVAALKDKLAALQDQLATATRQNNETANALKRSRLLKVGRWLRRIAGRPIPY